MSYCGSIGSMPRVSSWSRRTEPLLLINGMGAIRCGTNGACNSYATTSTCLSRYGDGRFLWEAILSGLSWIITSGPMAIASVLALCTSITPPSDAWSRRADAGTLRSSKHNVRGTLPFPLTRVRKNRGKRARKAPLFKRDRTTDQHSFQEECPGASVCQGYSVTMLLL